ncbi:hypothetical protein [Rhodococcus pyridinivorans]|uniref:Uncharacterized protein n=1 Tax=Rhodococcus pyridinivorans TaxID=103816 RepID=A0A7M2XQA7_9NOCA|nr:hypothetical protein [Rhodococcus pyridinivorans]QOV99522.1 hypothetical protein INP59_03725 [Rhodococcus pyridinivorans]
MTADHEGDPRALALRVLEQRKAGHPWDEIAETIGLPPELCASMLADALLDLPKLTAEVEARLDLERLDSLLVPIYRLAVERDNIDAVDRALRILARRGELLAALIAAGARGVDPDEIPDDDKPNEPEDEPRSAYLARVRRSAAAARPDAQVFSIVRGEQEDDDDD